MMVSDEELLVASVRDEEAFATFYEGTLTIRTKDGGKMRASVIVVPSAGGSS